MYYRIFKSLSAPYSGIAWPMWCLLISGFVNSMSIVVTIYIALGLNAQGYTALAIGKVLTAYGLLGVVGGYLGGVLCDKFLPARVCQLSLLASSILFLSYPLSNNYYYIIWVCSLIGFFSNIFRPAFILSLTQTSSANELENQAALRRVAINLGMAFGASICGLLAEHHYFYVFWFNASCSLAALVIMLKVPVPSLPAKNNKAKSGSRALNADTIYLLLVLFVVLLVFNQSQSTFPLFLKNQLLFNEKLISFIFTLNGLLIVLFQVPLTCYLKQHCSNRAYLYGVLFLCLGFGMNVWFKSYDCILLSCILWTVGEMIFFPAHLANLMRANETHTGLSMGLYQVISSASQLGAPIVGTFLYALNPDYLWYSCIVIAPCILLSSLMI